MKTFLIVLAAAAAAVLAQDLGQVEVEDAPSPRYNCPMIDIDLDSGNNLDWFRGIETWQECGM